MPVNDVRPLKPYLDHIAKRDGGLALRLSAALAAGDKTAIANDLARVRVLGLAADANAIQAWVNSHKLSTVPKRWDTSPGEVVGNAAGLAGAVTGVNVPGFLSALSNPHTWLRVAEVGIGVLLIAVGVAKLTNAVPAATRLAGAVGKLPI